MIFFVIELRTRAVHIAGARVNPDGALMLQIARNLVDLEDGFQRNATQSDAARVAADCSTTTLALWREDDT
jgi:hypothetical protein